MTNQPSRKKSYLKPSEVAELMRVEPGTVRTWVRSGALRATTTPGGHRRFAYRDVVEFARRHSLSLALPEDGAVRVLIVDDDPQVLALLERMLRSTVASPIDIELAHDGFSAGQRLAEFQPHIILLDLFMPGVNGMELCGKLKSDPSTADIRIIAMTGGGDSQAVEEVLSLGAERCLSKPIARADLLGALGLDGG